MAGPAPLDESTARRMRAVRRRDTAPEVALRRLLHAQGLRYFVDRPPMRGMRRRGDLVFPRLKIVVFVDGCFWHGCPEHATAPKSNAAWWADKLAANTARDRDTDERLNAAGWRVVRVWSHEAPDDAAERIASAVAAARVGGRS